MRVIFGLLLLGIGAVAQADWRAISKSEMSQLGGMPVRGTLGVDESGEAKILLFCGEGAMLISPRGKEDVIQLIVVDEKKYLEPSMQIGSMMTMVGIESAFKLGNIAQVVGTLKSIHNFSLAGFTVARNKSCS